MRIARSQNEAREGCLTAEEALARARANHDSLSEEQCQAEAAEAEATRQSIDRTVAYVAARHQRLQKIGARTEELRRAAEGPTGRIRKAVAYVAQYVEWLHRPAPESSSKQNGGRAPRRATNAHRRGSRRVAVGSRASPGDSDPDDPEPPSRWRRTEDDLALAAGRWSR